MLKSFFIAPIVEGKGEVEALPALLRRLFKSFEVDGYLALNPAIRVKAGSFVKPGDYFTRHIELAARKTKANPHGAVLVLLDCEDDCPAKLGPELLQRAQSVRSDVPYIVILAYREYESWFLSAAKSLRGVGGLPSDLEPPANSELIRGAKEWLGEKMPTGYDEIEHQPLFTEYFSLEEACSNRSFSRLREKIRSFLTQT